ncbi:MAG: HAD family hydrolase [Deltaproteobacteria bacterium]|nr:HAD family hydrolase [Deltaproteobacteria bacterium]
MRESGRQRVVFLDRDGTINEDVEYLSNPSGLVIIEGAGKAIRLLNERGIKVIVVTNQSGVGRGYFKDSDVEAVNARLKELLARDGASIDASYHCPHRPDEGCECRKPGTALAKRAAKEHGADLSRAYVVGDKSSDIGLARNLFAKGVLVLTGKGAKEAEGLVEPPDFIAQDLLSAVEWILEDMERTGG